MTSSINAETLAGLKALNEPGSNAFFSEIAATYIGDTALRFKAMWEAQGTGNAAEMARIAHTIKGSSLNIGADGLASRFQSIERGIKTGVIPSSELLRDAEEEFLRVKAELSDSLG